jgi:hypothetical protein
MANDDNDDDGLPEISDSFIDHLHIATIRVITANLSSSTNIIMIIK